jgi:hypothetical protein
MRGKLAAAWLVWLGTMPALIVFSWVAVERCMATTPGNDCGVAYMLVAGWLLPWAIGIGLLAFATVLVRPRAG